MPLETPKPERIAVIGLGYVGLPLALAFARKFPGTIGFDIKKSRVDALREGRDETNETSAEELSASTIKFTADPEDLKQATFFIVAVPTPVDKAKRPDLGPVEGASRIVGQALAPGAAVVYESTVYPGVTEDICAPILEKESGLSWKTGFHLGYSPERINPGDKEHTIDKIVKVVSGDDSETLARQLLAEAGVLVSPGDHFESPHHLRMRISCDRDTLVKGLEAFGGFLERQARRP
jgi:UDP-N-acetyl-D-galactosamine dehydrogenase